MDEQLTAHTYAETLPFDGAAVATDVQYNKTRRSASLRWNSDGLGFVVASSATKDGQAGSKVTENWSLDDGGKTLVIDRHVVQPDGFAYFTKAFYDKQ